MMKSTPRKQPDAWNFIHNNFCGEWFDGAPLGNGDLGGLMMAHHKQITFRLAKSDIWDERCDDGRGRRRSFYPFPSFAVLRRLIEQQHWDEIEAGFTKQCKKWRG